MEDLPSPATLAGTFVFSPGVTSPCVFPSSIFLAVMQNLLRNPNITSSHLFRADILWDSEKDATFNPDASPEEDLAAFVKHMRREYRPRRMYVDGGWSLERCVVRKLVPRNPGRDASLVQSCHFFRRMRPSQYANTDVKEAEETLVVYMPHSERASDVPWYHPPTQAVAFLHSWLQSSPNEEADNGRGTLSILVSLFEDANLGGGSGSSVASQRLRRTLQNLLSTILKHGDGNLKGYKKRVHHDRVIEQARLQDTYTRLKQAYSRELVAHWREQTDVTKGVFEDLGIAAFLVEVWRTMYSFDSEASTESEESMSTTSGDGTERKLPFPGFVDIGCGNGILVYILLREGYQGWGFDARRRKTWDAFPHHIRANLKEQVLIPSIFPSPVSTETTINNGIFQSGTFIISNHADELSLWTPLLAHLSQSPFVCIPCCSHDFSGARFRARACFCEDEQDAGLSDIAQSSSQNEAVQKPSPSPSAYATLCAYVAHLCKRVGGAGTLLEKEILRIPSTRNVCLMVRHQHTRQREQSKAHAAGCESNGDHFTNDADDIVEYREDSMRRVVEEEMGISIEEVGRKWIERAVRITKSPGTGRGH